MTLISREATRIIFNCQSLLFNMMVVHFSPNSLSSQETGYLSPPSGSGGRYSRGMSVDAPILSSSKAL